MKFRFIKDTINKVKNKNLKLHIIKLVTRFNDFYKKTNSTVRYINGESNKILCIYQGKENIIDKFYKTNNFQIIGSNNTLIFYNSKKSITKIPSGLDIKIIGNNNTIKIYEPNFDNSKIYIKNDNNYLEIQKTVKFVQGAYFCVEDGAKIIIEKNCEIGNGKLRLFANGDYNIKHKIHIGEGTHIAHDAIIRNSDGECIIDPINKIGLNEPKDIIIGKNCWITSRCTILKGTTLPNNTIVAACSLVNKKFTQENTLIAGSPAKIIKHNVHWFPGSYGKYMRNIENNK